MKVKFNKALLLCLAVCPLLLISKSSLASCFWDPNGSKKVITANVSFGSVIVQRDTPVGSVIASTATGSFDGGKKIFACSEAWTTNNDMVRFTTISSYGNKVYDTNIAGVGIRVSYSKDVVPFSTSLLPSQPMVIYSRTVDLVKTSTSSVDAGTLTTGEIVKIYPQQDPNFYAIIALNGTSTITPVACSVNTTVINVNLDDADATDFKGVGSTAKPKDFNIGLNCDAGTNVKLTLDGNSAGPAGVLSLNAGEHQASGIGIQVLNGTTPVVLGQQLDLGTAGKTGDMQIPLVAQYYQTDASIVAGLTNATATFTMVYN
jgi:type 1 fimbria pilin